MTLNKKTMLYLTLARALSMKRPSKSDAERALAAWLAQRMPDQLRNKTSFDAAGNLHVDARQTSANRTLFVAHMDTVHRAMGPNKIRKTNTHWYADGDALGADDGAGCAMLMHLIHSGIAAYYIFTVSEECGGIGAKFMARDRDLLADFDRAIAFDRRGIDSVITHQSRGRCCSDKFAEALANELCADMTLMYSPDNTGVYTDTAEFTEVIPECTNISVGYYNEHSERESLDIIHFAALAARVVNIDWDALPTDRDPSVVAINSYWDDWRYGTWEETTSVRASSLHYLYDDDTEELREELREAIYDAMAGSKQWLIEIMCASVWPDDPEMAEQFVDRNKLDEGLLTVALQQSDVYDPDVVMATVFDQVYKGV